jgi:uncharacterized protein YodC (DUF2158 family)
MTEEIRAGDVVQIKSGGPDMTVVRIETINGEICAICGWMLRGKSQVGTFPLHILKHKE